MPSQRRPCRPIARESSTLPEYLSPPTSCRRSHTGPIDFAVVTVDDPPPRWRGHQHLRSQQSPGLPLAPPWRKMPSERPPCRALGSRRSERRRQLFCQLKSINPSVQIRSRFHRIRINLHRSSPSACQEMPRLPMPISSPDQPSLPPNISEATELLSHLNVGTRSVLERSREVGRRLPHLSQIDRDLSLVVNLVLH